ncbi:polymorphic toxin type 17 domain-containing protein [Thermoactinospora rubra]|uniref:polymorphic toxin type 17 domain-containing protein n=1 Tax=Thermoactinospora rubra TaxID=1088767 RepID=UPI00117D1664|nr:polymorphic toxin type 17 domain-containing protein [Thermoactinospora rubra]
MPPDRDNAEFAGIDPVQLKGMIGDLDDVRSMITAKIPGLRHDFARAGLDTKHIGTLEGVARWIAGELPMLRRRQSMTEQIAKEHGQFGFTGSMVESEWEGHFKSPEEARAKAKELAAKYQHPGEFPADVWEQIRKYQFDPDFAEAFARELGPDKLGWLAGRAKSAESWGDDKEAGEARFQAIANILAVASHRGVIDDKWLDGFHPDGRGTDYNTLAALMMHGTWNKDTLVKIGNRALKIGQLGGGNYTTAKILDAIARNPLAAHELYKANFDQINAMAYGKHMGWMSTSDPKLGDPLGRFLKAATVDAADAFERMRPPGDDKWKNPADELAMRLFDHVAKNHYAKFPFQGVEDNYISIIEKFFEGTYIEELTGEGGLTWTDAVQITAGVVGIFDPTPISDGIDALISLGRGDWKGALLSAVAFIPWIGDAAAKPVKIFKRLVDSYPGFKTLLGLDPALLKKIEENPLDLSKDEIEALKKGLEKAKGDIENITKIAIQRGPQHALDALTIANRMHVDAAAIYAKKPKFLAKAKSLHLPTDGPIPFVPPKNWQPNNPQKATVNGREGFVDAYGNVWHKGRGVGQTNYEWDVQTPNTPLGKLTGDGNHLNVEWETGRITHGKAK